MNEEQLIALHKTFCMRIGLTPYDAIVDKGVMDVLEGRQQRVMFLDIFVTPSIFQRIQEAVLDDLMKLHPMIKLHTSPKANEPTELYAVHGILGSKESFVPAPTLH